MNILPNALRLVAEVAGPTALHAGERSAEALPAEPGAYLLALRLDEAATPRIVTLGQFRLPPGWYVYVGSARGPGGLRARLRRHLLGHLRPDRKIRWHVDHLTSRAAERHAFAVPDGAECALVAALLSRDGATVPVPGFGSSDCARCPAHLLRLA